MKWVKRIALVLVVVLAVVALVANFYLGKLVKLTVEKAGPAVVGVPLHLEEANFRLLRGFVSLKGFVLGNPEGFRTDSAISVGEIVVDLNMRSLLSDTVVIRRIYVKDPSITYEMGLGKSNIGRILEQLEGEEARVDEKPAKAGKRVIIEDFLIEGGQVRLSATVALGAAAPLPLPSIHLTDIGKESGSDGASPAQVIRQVFGAIVNTVTGVVTGSVKLVGDGVGAVGEGAVKAVGAMGEGAGKAVGAVGDGAGKLLGGLKDLVPGGEEP